MEYLITFIEGIASFISPCILPVIPIYISYFATESKSMKKSIINSLGFVDVYQTGFTSKSKYGFYYYLNQTYQ